MSLRKKNTKKNSRKKQGSKVSLEEYYGELHVPIIVLNKKMELVFLNEAAEDLTGYTLKSFNDKGFLNVFSKKNKEEVDSTFKIIFHIHGQSSHVINDITLIKKNGKRVHIDFSVKFSGFNKVDRAIVVLHDLSELVKIQKDKEIYINELNHMTKLADIGQLTAGVAHELNNPLMIVQGFAENIQMLFDQNNYDKDEIKNQISPIIKASDRMAKIIGTMMKLAREDEVVMVHVDLREIVEDALAFLKNRFSEMNIQVEKKMKSPHGVVKCDPNQIEQIILNILNNAFHALQDKPEGGRKIKITLDIKDKVLLSIWNNGPEIPSRIQSQVMTPFFTTKPVGEGTGLGLSLSYGIMKAHGGDLTFSSKKEEGTEFKLEFPIVSLGKIPKKVQFKRNILVVDDEEFILELFKHKLSRYGYEVYTAKNGEEALNVFSFVQNIDCVFTDIRMPKMDGVQLIKQIKKDHAKTLIYAFSGYAGKKALEMKVKRLGINGFLTKPIDHLLFSKIINELEEHFAYIHGKGKDLVS
ncbi:MAG: response regulator [Bdellovibrionaceae bacterium]|nr:response regulator [Pseudobdellovibrionaceae bacterium]